MTGVRALHTWWGVSEWEFREAVKRTRAAQQLPWGQRKAAKRLIAADYGVSLRTVERWVNYRVYTAKVGGFHALFVVGDGRPSQVTPWEPAA